MVLVPGMGHASWDLAGIWGSWGLPKEAATSQRGHIVLDRASKLA